MHPPDTAARSFWEKMRIPDRNGLSLRPQSIPHIPESCPAPRNLRRLSYTEGHSTIMSGGTSSAPWMKMVPDFPPTLQYYCAKQIFHFHGKTAQRLLDCGKPTPHAVRTREGRGKIACLRYKFSSLQNGIPHLQMLLNGGSHRGNVTGICPASSAGLRSEFFPLPEFHYEIATRKASVIYIIA